MEKFEYQVLAEEDFNLIDSMSTSVPAMTPAKRLQAALANYGQQGFRFISSLYSANGNWIIILSRPVNSYPDAPQRGYSNRRPFNERGRNEDRSQGQFSRRERF